MYTRMEKLVVKGLVTMICTRKTYRSCKGQREPLKRKVETKVKNHVKGIV